MAPRVTSPHPETDRLEARQLRMCLLSKRVEVLRQKSKDQDDGSQRPENILRMCRRSGERGALEDNDISTACYSNYASNLLREVVKGTEIVI